MKHTRFRRYDAKTEGYFCFPFVFFAWQGEAYGGRLRVTGVISHHSGQRHCDLWGYAPQPNPGEGGGLPANGRQALIACSNDNQVRTVICRADERLQILRHLFRPMLVGALRVVRLFRLGRSRTF